MSHLNPDFSYISNEDSRIILQDAYEQAIKLDLVSFFKYEDPPTDTGYAFWDDFRLIELAAHCNYGHSGSSFAWTCRALQYYFKNRTDTLN